MNLSFSFRALFNVFCSYYFRIYLFQYIDTAMESSRAGKVEVASLNQTLEASKHACRRTQETNVASQNAIKSGKTLLVKSRGLVGQASQHFSDLAEAFERMQEWGKGLEETEIGLSAIVEDYRER